MGSFAQATEYAFDEIQKTVVTILGPSREYPAVSIVKNVFHPGQTYQQRQENLSRVLKKGESFGVVKYGSVVLFARKTGLICPPPAQMVGHTLSSSEQTPCSELEYLRSSPSFIFKDGWVVLPYREQVEQEGSQMMTTVPYVIHATALVTLDENPEFPSGKTICVTKSTLHSKAGRCGEVKYQFANKMIEVRFRPGFFYEAEVIPRDQLAPQN